MPAIAAPRLISRGPWPKAGSTPASPTPSGKAGRAAARDIQCEALGALRRQRKFQGAAKSDPVGLRRVFPAAKPLQPIGHVADFVAVDFFEELSRSGVAHGGKAAAIMSGEIQICLLEGKAETRHIINGMLHWRHAAPEIATDGKVAKGHAAGVHALNIKPCVFLFILEGLQHALAKGGGRLGKLQQDQRHQFGGQQFMIAEKMEQLAAFGNCFEPV